MRRYLPLLPIALGSGLACAAPVVVNQVTPATGPTAGGIKLTLTGSGFGGTPSVTVGVNSCPVTSAGDGSIVCTLPPGQGVNLQVKVVAAPLEVSNTVAFSYLPPSITQVTPASGAPGGGAALAIAGANFGTGAPAVTVGDKPCVLTGPVSHTALTCTAPAGSGVQPVVVTVETQASAPFSFTYLTPPVVAGVSPSSGAAVGGTAVTLTGSDLGPNPTVTIGGNLCMVTSASAASVTCTSPPGSGAQPVVVTVAGQPSAPATYTYTTMPVITAINPTGGPTAGGTPITITGSSLAPNPAVTIDGKPCVVTSASPLVCISPPGQGAKRPVVVTVATVASAAALFSYNPPVIVGISPSSGPAAGGTTIVIAGSNFGSSPSVLIDAAACEVKSRTETSIACVTPAGRAGKAVLTVSAGEQSGTGVFSYQ